MSVYIEFEMALWLRVFPIWVSMMYKLKQFLFEE